MKTRVEPGTVSGIITAPPSKSMTQRVYAAALLHCGKTVVHGAGNSDDERVALQIIQQLGAKIISRTDNTVEIVSCGAEPISDTIHCGESGLAARLFIPIAALSNQAIKVTGEGSLLKRPMNVFADVLPHLNVAVTTTHGHLPIQLKGPLLPANIEIEGSSSSQFLSGMLFAFCYAKSGQAVVIKAHELKSKPYIDLTIYVLQHFGNHIVHDNYKTFQIGQTDPGVSGKEISITIDGDWSSAAYFLAAGAIAGEITVKGLQNNRLQADSAIFDLLVDMRADIVWDAGNIRVKPSRLKCFEFDATDCPDLFPVLAILAACCGGESYIKGVHRLFHKESNRAESISEMLGNFAVPFSMEGDSLCITGVRKLQGTVIDSYHDHRIVMAAVIGALRANGPVDILHADAVNKSYPDFFKELIKVHHVH